VSFLTVHKSKGLEADYVVILDVTARRNGFPSQLQNDPVLTLVLPSNDEIRHAEERRVFYVALTRARHRVFVCTPPQAPSVFASELEEPAYKGFVDSMGRTGDRVACRTCGSGFLVRTRGSRAGHPWVCSKAPACGGHAALCPKCSDGAFVQHANLLLCSRDQCRHTLAACPACGRGYLREYMTKKGARCACSLEVCGYRGAAPRRQVD